MGEKGRVDRRRGEKKVTVEITFDRLPLGCRSKLAGRPPSKVGVQ